MSKTKTKMMGGAQGKKQQVLVSGEKPMSSTKLYLILCFAVPFLLMSFAYAYNGVYPFGDQQILVTDFWQQYFPFLTEVQDKLQTGQSFLYSWDTGMGSNFWGIAAYYYASPFNLLLTFVPYEFLREALTVFLLCRIGFAGLFCGICLKGVFKRNDPSLVFFGTMYALCAFTLGYYWNIMWFDTFALLPLVSYGCFSLVKYGRVRLYIISLAMSLFFNYYIGFFTCIFTLILFICLCIYFKTPWHILWRRFLKIGVSSVAAIAMTAVITLPEVYVLGMSYSANNVWPSISEYINTVTDLIGNFAAMSTPNAKEGLPNVYCGYLCVLLAGMFVVSKKIKLREKILFCAVLFVLLLSVNNKLLDFIWHGFHSTNMIPHRFSFIISFVLVCLAFKAFTLLKDITPVELIGMLAVSAIVILCALFGQQTDTAVYTSVVLTVLYVGIFLLYERKLINMNVVYVLMGIVFLGEMISSVLLSVETVRTTTRTGYPDRYDDVRACVEDIEAKDDEEFYRMEFTQYYTINDPPLYQYPGIAQFSSTANVSVTNFLESIGVAGWDAGNRYYYSETTPLTNAFLDLKYLIAKNGHISDTNNWTLDGSEGGINYYKNNRYLSLGFMTQPEMESYKGDKDDLFDAQQRLFESATGLDKELYEKVNVTTAAHNNLSVYYRNVDANGQGIYGQYRYTSNDTSTGSTLSWNYEIPRDSSVYVYARIDNTENVNISGGESNPTAHSYNTKRPYIISAGVFKAGETLNVSANLDAGVSGTADIYVCMLNQDVFDEGYELLSDELLEINEMDDTNVKGEISVKEDGLLYTSIPYEKGWSAYVDGVEVETTSVDNAMLALNLSAGEHTVEFKYTPSGFTAGLIITITAILLFALYCLASWYLRKSGKSLGPLGKLPEEAGDEGYAENSEQAKSADGASKSSNRKKRGR